MRYCEAQCDDLWINDNTVDSCTRFRIATTSFTREGQQTYVCSPHTKTFFSNCGCYEGGEEKMFQRNKMKGREFVNDKYVRFLLLSAAIAQRSCLLYHFVAFPTGRICQTVFLMAVKNGFQIRGRYSAFWVFWETCLDPPPPRGGGFLPFSPPPIEAFEAAGKNEPFFQAFMDTGFCTVKY